MRDTHWGLSRVKGTKKSELWEPKKGQNKNTLYTRHRNVVVKWGSKHMKRLFIYGMWTMVNKVIGGINEKKKKHLQDNYLKLNSKKYGKS